MSIDLLFKPTDVAVGGILHGLVNSLERLALHWVRITQLACCRNRYASN